MLAYINPEAAKPSAISIFTKPGCPFCVRAKQLLADKNLRYQEVVLGKDINSATLKAVSGRSTVPQVFIDGQHIGGSEELAAYFA
nr:glutaredoxin domain-containing protein [Oceanisphaera avium]